MEPKKRTQREKIKRKLVPLKAKIPRPASLSQFSLSLTVTRSLSFLFSPSSSINMLLPFSFSKIHLSFFPFTQPLSRGADCRSHRDRRKEIKVGPFQNSQSSLRANLWCFWLPLRDPTGRFC